MSVTPNLRKTIDKLVKLDEQRQAASRNRYGDSVTFGGTPMQEAKALELIHDVLNSRDPVEQLLSTLSQDDLIYIQALMSFGRDDSFPSFEAALKHAKSNYNENTPQYLAGKNLAKDLPASFTKLRI